MTRRFFAACALLVCTGCLTVHETAPETLSFATVSDVRVQLEGFDATVTTYDMAYGYTTAVHHGLPWYGRRGFGWGGPAVSTCSTTEFIPHTQATPIYRDRAADLLERGGCILRTTQPRYRVEVHFDGPFVGSGDAWATVGWTVLTLFTADFGAQEWTARLRVHDLTSGKLVFSRDYAQRDEAVVWGPIPIFSCAFTVRTTSEVQKHNCLCGLTDRAIADILKFLSGVS